MVGFISGNSRVLVCGGQDHSRRLVNTCYYLERSGNDLLIGGAPQYDLPSRGACYASDGVSLVFAGGNTRENDGSNTYTDEIRVLEEGSTEWEELEGDGLLDELSSMAGVRLGDHLWCLGGFRAVSGVGAEGRVGKYGWA